ncbi:MAG: flagellar basal body-associated FliL family protein [Fimbriimonadales bacterium]
MSEAKKTEEAPKKKKGKLPMIIALVAILGGGGFFMMKGKGGDAKKPAIVLGAIEPMPEEFLVNLSTSPNYLRTAISLHMAKDFKKEDLEHNIGAVQDAIGSVLSSKMPSQIRTLKGKKALKEEIARAINEVLAEGHEADKGKEKPKEEKKKDEKAPENDWDSQTGPVLKVYFTSFATQ